MSLIYLDNRFQLSFVYEYKSSASLYDAIITISNNSLFFIIPYNNSMVDSCALCNLSNTITILCSFVIYWKILITDSIIFSLSKGTSLGIMSSFLSQYPFIIYEINISCITGYTDAFLTNSLQSIYL